MNFKLLKFIIIIVFLLLPIIATADRFITKSKILKENNLKIFVGENQKEAVVFHLNDLDNINDENIFFLTSKGSHSLKGKLNKMKLLNECDRSDDGIGFEKENKNGFFIASGQNVHNIITWNPSKKIRKKESRFCGLPPDQSVISKNLLFTSDALDQTIYQVRWKRELTKVEIDNRCKGHAEYNMKIFNYNDVARYKEMYESCLKWDCNFESKQVTGMINKKGQCKELYNSTSDCDGQPSLLDEFLGVLKLKDNSQEESWLIWNAPGYEGDGIYAIEKKDLGKKENVNSEWLIYNGC